MASAPRRRRLTPQQRRDELLDVAAALLAARRGDPPSVEQVAAAAGVSRALAYTHFDSRTSLLLALLDRETNRYDTEVVERLRGISDPEQWLEVATGVYFDAVEATGHLYLALFEERQADAEVERRREARQRLLVDGVSFNLSQILGVKAQETRITSVLLLGMLRAAAELVVLEERERDEVEQRYLRAARCVIESLRTDGPR